MGTDPSPSQRLSETLREQVAALRPDWRLSELSGFLYLEGGYSNANYRFEYRGERYVLRAPRSTGDRRAERRLYQHDGMALMPEVVAFDPDTGHMISRWVAGALLADLSAQPEALIDYLQELHRGVPALERAYDPVAQARAHLAAARGPAWLEELGQRLRWQPARLQACHNDLNPWNVIRTPDGRWVTLDWEWAGLNDPLFDLVTLHQGVGAPDATLTAWARSYVGGAVAETRLGDCLRAFWLRETAWALAQIAAGNDRPEIVEQSRLGLSRLQALEPAR